MASVYDLFFGLPLHHGRAKAIRRMAIKPNDQILEVGVGTGISLPLYPRACSVTAVDLSEGCSSAHATRVAQYNLRNVHLIQMDATQLKFPGQLFRHRLRAVFHQLRSRSARRDARDAPRLPARRATGVSESLSERRPDRVDASSGPSRR